MCLIDNSHLVPLTQWNPLEEVLKDANFYGSCVCGWGGPGPCPCPNRSGQSMRWVGLDWQKPRIRVKAKSVRY